MWQHIKRELALPQIWLIRQSENFAENQPDTIRPLTFKLRYYIAPGCTRLQGAWGTQSVPRKKLSPQEQSIYFCDFIMLTVQKNENLFSSSFFIAIKQWIFYYLFWVAEFFGGIWARIMAVIIIIQPDISFSERLSLRKSQPPMTAKIDSRLISSEALTGWRYFWA